MNMSQRPNIELSGITPQRTGVPADHIDPNHPYFPHDDEAQLPPRPFYQRHSFFTKKRFLIPTFTILITALLIAALLGGIKIGLSRCPHEPPPVYQTTTVTSTPVHTTQDATTITTTVRTTPTKTVPFEAPVRQTPVKPVESICSEKGSWPSVEECRGNCFADGKFERAMCVPWTGGFTCRICSSAHA